MMSDTEFSYVKMHINKTISHAHNSIACQFADTFYLAPCSPEGTQVRIVSQYT